MLLSFNITPCVKMPVNLYQKRKTELKGCMRKKSQSLPQLLFSIICSFLLNCLENLYIRRNQLCNISHLKAGFKKALLLLAIQYREHGR